MIPLEEWEDEGIWETLDLRDKNGRGMPVEKFLLEIRENSKNHTTK